MSIENCSFFSAPTRVSTAPVTPAMTPPTPKRKVSQRRLAANRINAKRSTGPRTAAGKRRSSRNALKHGLCAASAIPECEDMPTFRIFLAEIEEELQPVSILQKILFPQIANLIWQLRRLPEAQAAMFQRELDKAADDNDDAETLTPSQLIARRFSEDPGNGFALLGRYEHRMQAMLLRLLREYHNLKKNHPYTPYHPSALEPGQKQPGEKEFHKEFRAQQKRRELDERAYYTADLRQQHIALDDERFELEQQLDEEKKKTAALQHALAEKEAEQSQSKPTESASGEAESRKCSTPSSAPGAERSQGDEEGDKATGRTGEGAKRCDTASSPHRPLAPSPCRPLDPRAQK